MTSTLVEAAPAPAANLRAARILVACYLGLSLLAVVALVVLAVVAPALATVQAWFRGVIIGGTAVLTFVIAGRAVAGRPRALLRLRIVVVVLLVAVVAVLCFLPLPLWMVVEQAVCGALLLATAVLLFSGRR